MVLTVVGLTVIDVARYNRTVGYPLASSADSSTRSRCPPVIATCLRALARSQLTGISPIGVCFVGSPRVPWVNRCAMSAALRSRSRLTSRCRASLAAWTACETWAMARLFGEGWKKDFNRMDYISVQRWHADTGSVLLQVHVGQQVVNELRRIPVEIRYPQYRIERPVITFDPRYFSGAPTSPDTHTSATRYRFGMVPYRTI